MAKTGEDGCKFLSCDLRSRTGITLIGLVLLVLIWLLTNLSIENDPRIFFSFLLICLGAALGSLVGALASPWDSQEKHQFTTLAGIVSSFLTGTLYATLHPQIATYLSSPSESVQTRLVSFLLSVILGGFVMYAFRAYSGSKGATGKGSPSVESTLGEHIAQLGQAMEKLGKAYDQERERVLGDEDSA